MCARAEARGNRWVPVARCLAFLKQCLSLNPELAMVWLGWLVSPQDLPISVLVVLRLHTSHPDFYMGAGVPMIVR